MSSKSLSLPNTWMTKLFITFSLADVLLLEGLRFVLLYYFGGLMRLPFIICVFSMVLASLSQGKDKLLVEDFSWMWEKGPGFHMSCAKVTFEGLVILYMCCDQAGMSASDFSLRAECRAQFWVFSNPLGTSTE